MRRNDDIDKRYFNTMTIYVLCGSHILSVLCSIISGVSMLANLEKKRYLYLIRKRDNPPQLIDRAHYIRKLYKTESIKA